MTVMEYPPIPPTTSPAPLQGEFAVAGSEVALMTPPAAEAVAQAPLTPNFDPNLLLMLGRARSQGNEVLVKALSVAMLADIASRTVIRYSEAGPPIAARVAAAEAAARLNDEDDEAPVSSRRRRGLFDKAA
jgi:hypothetical protein